MRLTVDFESRSRVDIRKRGGYVYSEDPSTEILLLSIKIDDAKPVVIVNSGVFRPDVQSELTQLATVYNQDPAAMMTLTRRVDWLFDLLARPGVTVEAHNAVHFELPMWRNVCVRRLGWPDIPDDRWRCSQAKCAASNIPQSLDASAKALGLAEEKDETGHRLMLKMCKPRKPTKSNPYEWHEDPKDIIRLAEYCAQDTNTSRAVSLALPDLNPYEQQVFEMDLRINHRGIPVDVEAAGRMVALSEALTESLLDETGEITGGAVCSPRQVAALGSYLKDKHEVELQDLRANTVQEALSLPGLDPEATRLLKIRQMLGKSSVSKYSVMVNNSIDGRVKGAFRYHAASTGRWGGKDIQPQNLPSRGVVPYWEAEDFIREVMAYPPEVIKALHGDSVWMAMSSAIRGMILAPEGYEFVVADYSAIEARGLAWVAGEAAVLNAFRKRLDLYKVAASGIYGVKYEDITGEQRSVGKVAVLALGYQGSWRAFVSMASGYGLEPPSGDALTPNDYYDPMTGKPLTEDEARWCKFAAPIVKAWRASNPNIVSFWVEVERAAVSAARDGGTHDVRGMVQFGVHGDFLLCRLPSGRHLSFHRPEVDMKKMPWKDDSGNPVYKESLYFWGVDSITKKYRRMDTYGGKLTENIVQGLCRDLLADAMLRLEAIGRPVVLHVHDEVGVLTEKGVLTVKELEDIMSIQPAWAVGFPVEAEGWSGPRYRKDKELKKGNKLVQIRAMYRLAIDAGHDPDRAVTIVSIGSHLSEYDIRRALADDIADYSPVKKAGKVEVKI